MGNRLRMFGVWNSIDRPSVQPVMAGACLGTGSVEVDRSPTPQFGERLPTGSHRASACNPTVGRWLAAGSEAIQNWLKCLRVDAPGSAPGVRNRDQDETTPACTCCEVILHLRDALCLPNYVVPPIRRGQAAPQTQIVDSHRGARPRLSANRASHGCKGMAR